MILVDTSAWVDFFRGGTSAATKATADRVQELLLTNQAAVCGPVLTELRVTLRPRDRARVLRGLEGARSLSTPIDLWVAAGELGYAMRRKSVAVGTVDLLVASHALAHDVPVLTRDGDFAAIARIAPLRLAAL